ncbi:MAG: radical SAM protein, partial [Geitlerinemataceae cyanobacterium]
VKSLSNRLSSYVRYRQLKQIIVVFHGGEPLLLGATKLREFFTILSSSFQDVEADVKFGLQTNGTLVDDEIVKVLQEFDVRAGVSIDGPQEWNDRVRVDVKGNGSFSQVMAGVEKLRNPQFGNSVFGGFLTVANPEIDPYDILSFFEKLNTPSIDFLLPDFNFDTFPYDRYTPGTFGRWLSNIFDYWISSENNMEVRLFRTIMKLLMGGNKGFDSIGALSDGVLVIETDGTYHGLDVLKTTYHGITKTGMSLESEPINFLESLPLIKALSTKHFSASQKCLDCRLFKVCGGGYLPHRYSSTNGFNRESIYCEDLIMLIEHIQFYLSTELSRIANLSDA